MTKKSKKHEHTIIHPNAEKVGAIILTAVSVLVSFEAIVEHSSKFGHGGNDPNKISGSSEIFMRAEPKGETARLPEEFDIGLQSPHIAGL
jgi:hypothetical protein